MNEPKISRILVRSSMVLEKRGTISEDEIRPSFFFFLYDKKGSVAKFPITPDLL
ncbi:hypothetical protein LLDRC3_03760 (plasmid) [Lactococcus lactis subsp. lactis]|jgi:hypothetical protein|uniref:hypothetical protein n=1 Tax=Lactococcus TaxID=1357 RepID=UPI001AE8EA98|nr:hypothetical protein [Lactococcus lactis]WKK99625.1 hypothetical protein LLDRC3_03760 [Lactococcus lactis subsp. lactis]